MYVTYFCKYRIPFLPENEERLYVCTSMCSDLSIYKVIARSYIITAYIKNDIRKLSSRTLLLRKQHF